MRLELPEPPSANRWWRKWRGRMVLSTEARAYIRSITRIVPHPRPFLGEVRVDLIWHRQRRTGDLDKRVGILLDALQGIAYQKDAQVRELTARRSDVNAKVRSGPRGWVFVTITELPAES